MTALTWKRERPGVYVAGRFRVERPGHRFAWSLFVDGSRLTVHWKLWQAQNAADAWLMTHPDERALRTVGE